jgi:hypothetical protein
MDTWGHGHGLERRPSPHARTGRRTCSSNALATGCDGDRTPTKPVDAVTSGGMQLRLRTTMVSGPGQNCVVSRRNSRSPAASTSTTSSASATVSTCTMSGSDAGRPLNWKILRTAASLRALAPRPYTVSVGNATHCTVTATAATCHALRPRQHATDATHARVAQQMQDRHRGSTREGACGGEISPAIRNSDRVTQAATVAPKLLGSGAGRTHRSHIHAAVHGHGHHEGLQRAPPSRRLP